MIGHEIETMRAALSDNLRSMYDGKDVMKTLEKMVRTIGKCIDDDLENVLMKSVIDENRAVGFVHFAAVGILSFYEEEKSRLDTQYCGRAE